MNIIRHIAGFLALAMLCVAGNAHAAYPDKPVTIVSPYGAGGAADLASRIMAAEAPEYLGGTILVVNRTGAGGVTGSVSVARGPKDGSQVLLGRVGSQSSGPAMNTTIPYQWDEFSMMGIFELNPFVIAVSTNSPYQTFEDLTKALKSGDKKLSYSSSGVGTLLHLASLVVLGDLNLASDSHIHVPFKGGGNAVAAVANGNVDFVFQNLSGLTSGIDGGQLRPLVVTTKERVPNLPNVPTVREVGHPNLEVIIGWSGIWGPEGMDKEAFDKWVEVLGKIKTDESWLAATKKLGSIPAVMSPEQSREFVRKQFTAFREIAVKLDILIK